LAAESLMPRQAVRRAFTSSIAECSTVLGMSDDATRWRLYNLGLALLSPMPRVPEIK
jgi:hypothetical protein